MGSRSLRRKLRRPSSCVSKNPSTNLAGFFETPFTRGAGASWNSKSTRSHPVAFEYHNCAPDGSDGGGSKLSIMPVNFTRHWHVLCPEVRVTEIALISNNDFFDGEGSIKGGEVKVQKNVRTNVSITGKMH